jgi:hypothetical protein
VRYLGTFTIWATVAILLGGFGEFLSDKVPAQKSACNNQKTKSDEGLHSVKTYG